MPGRKKGHKKKSSKGDDLREEVLGTTKYLSGKIGKDELIRRLRNTATLLSDFEQDSKVRGSELDEIAKDLVSATILKHKDQGVKLFAACCLSDVLRIYAPDAPYTNDQLKAVFNLFVKQLRGLEKPSAASFARHFYLLERLAVVKSFIIVIDLGEEDTLLELFSMFFDVISSKHSNKVESHMLDILESIIAEHDAISPELLDTIFVNLVEPYKSDNVPAYNMATEVISRSADKLQQYVTQFFSDVLFRGQSSEYELAEDVHALLLEVYRAAPSALLHILPNLETLLKEEDVAQRRTIVELLGLMCCEDGDLSSTNPPLFAAYMDRLTDLDVKIRVMMANYCKEIAFAHPEMAKRMGDALLDRCRDADDKVRKAAVAALAECCISFPTAMSAAHITELKERLRDRKPAVRAVVQAKLTQLYTTAREVNPKSVSWIPDALISLRNQDDINLSTRIEIDVWLENAVLGEDADVETRTDRLLHVFSELSSGPGHRNALDALLVQKTRIQGSLRAYIKLRAEKKRDLGAQVMGRIAQALWESSKNRDAMIKIHEMKDAKIFKLLNTALSSDSTFEAITKAVDGINSRMPSKHALPIAATMRNLLLMATNRMMCVDVVEYLFIKLEDTEEVAEINAILNLLVVISRHFPDSFMGSYTALGELLQDSTETTVNVALLVFVKCGKYLQSMNPKLCKVVGKRLVELGVSGTPFQAKNAVRCIVAIFDSDPKPICNTLMKAAASRLKITNLASGGLSTVLKSYSYIALLCPKAFEGSANTVLKFVREELLPATDAMRAEDDDDGMERDWGDLSPNCEAKVIGIKLLAHFLKGLEHGGDVLGPQILQDFTNLLDRQGEPCDTDVTSDWDKAHIRLAAAKAMLKVARERHIEEKIMTPEQFHTVAMCMQDGDYEVRRLFSTKVHELLGAFFLPVHYLSLFALASVDPERENVDRAKRYLKHLTKTWRLKASKNDPSRHHMLLPEYALPYLLHMLAHHPDFDKTDVEELHNFEKYLQIFLESVTHQQDNFNFVKQMLSCIRSVVDRTAPHQSDNVYALCELSDIILTKQANTKKWNLVTFPGQLRFSQKLFERSDQPIQSGKNYLPPEFSLNVRKTQEDRILMSPSKPSPKKISNSTPSKMRGLTPPPRKKAPKAKAPKAKAPKAKTTKKTTKKKSTKKGKKTASSFDGPVLGRLGNGKRKTPSRRNASRSSRPTQSYKEKESESEGEDEDEDEAEELSWAVDDTGEFDMFDNTPETPETPETLGTAEEMEEDDDIQPPKKKARKGRAIASSTEGSSTPRRSQRTSGTSETSTPASRGRKRKR